MYIFPLTIFFALKLLGVQGLCVREVQNMKLWTKKKSRLYCMFNSAVRLNELSNTSVNSCPWFCLVFLIQLGYSRWPHTLTHSVICVTSALWTLYTSGVVQTYLFTAIVITFQARYDYPLSTYCLVFNCMLF